MTVVMMRSDSTNCFRFMIEAIFMACLILQLVCAEAAEVRCIETEKQALLAFKAGLLDDHAMLSSWEHKHDCCQWKGVGCSNQTGHVQSLDLHGDIIENVYTFVRRYLGGKISTSLLELQQLSYLNLNSNVFEGNHIPEFFGSMSNLRHLDLSFCHFGGKIPTQFGSLSRLKYLNLGFNRLEGSIPYQLGNLSKLQYLYLNNNGLQGKIPSNLGNLSKLQYLDLSWNQLQGTIPSQLGKLWSLQELYLGDYSYGTLRIDDGSNTGGQWLSNLTSLTHLNMGGVINLNSSYDWLQKIANLSQLRDLNLDYCGLSDHFILSASLSPSEFKFPRLLSALSLSGNTFTPSTIFQWLSNVTSNIVKLDLSYSFLEGGYKSNHFDIAMKSLEQLDLSHNTLKADDLKSFMNICTLTSLDLFQTSLAEDLQSILHNLSAGCVSHSLQELYLMSNQITGGILPDLSIFPSLKTLSLWENRLKGKIPENIKLPSQLNSVSFASNYLEGGIPKSFGNACNLRFFGLSDNNLNEELHVILQHLSGCARYSLQSLDLSNNQINGTLSDLSIFPSLETLDLSENRLDGKISEDIQFPSKLKTLKINSNSLTGVITESHFANMSNLKVLDLFGNPLALKFSHNWVPSFQLEVMKLGECKLGPSFPQWMQTQNNLMKLDISNAEISDIIPDWFWALSVRLDSLNISYNNLSGVVPNFPIRLTEYPFISLASNQLEGSIPLFFRRAESLDLSNNKFSDFNSFVCANDIVERLGQLDLSNNNFSSQIPNCWGNFKSLAYIDLSNNNLSGQLPPSMGSASELRVLILRNNSLSGELPLSLRNCTNMAMLDAGDNRFSGVIPSWIGSLGQLQMLSLRKNHLFGSLPFSLCYLTSIHLLDLSSNNLRGRIPKCFKNFTAMAQEGFSRDATDHHYYTVNHTDGPPYAYDYDLIALLMWKGVDRIVKNNKLLLKSIDLSSNQFSEDIPTELGNLVELVSLNLSRNNLTGKIPWEIGRLGSLDVLDLSRNHLFGSIPSSLAKIYRLSVLDLSHNKLSGKIPTATQLQSFDASSYEENQDLCGPPLEKMCFEEQSPHGSSVEIQEDDRDGFHESFYASMGLGFFVGFLGTFCTILFNRSCRHASFRFFNNLTNKFISRW